MKVKTSRLCLMMMASLAFATLSAMAAENDNLVPQDVFNGMRENFRPGKAKGVHVRYQWELTGPDGGQWWIEVNDGKCEIGKGKIDNPTMTFIASDQDWVALANGKLGGTWAFLTGRLKIRGDQKWARKLDEMFP